MANSWEEGLKSCAKNANREEILGKAEFVIFSKEGSLCADVGVVGIADKPDAATVANLFSAFKEDEKVKNELRTAGIKLGGEKWTLVNDRNGYITFKNKKKGAVFVDGNKYMVCGLTDDFQPNQSNVILVCEKAAEWLKPH